MVPCARVLASFYVEGGDVHVQFAVVVRSREEEEDTF
jgi:hypothetical protein